MATIRVLSLWVLFALCCDTAVRAAEQGPRHASERSVEVPATRTAGPTQPTTGVPATTGPSVEFPEYTKPKDSGTHHWTSVEVYLSFAVLVFAVIVLALQTFLIVKIQGWDPKSVLRMNCLTLVIASALLLITAGYSAEQVAPAMGLLGSIGGYLLGSAERKGQAE